MRGKHAKRMACDQAKGVMMGLPQPRQRMALSAAYCWCFSLHPGLRGPAWLSNEVRCGRVDVKRQNLFSDIFRG